MLTTLPLSCAVVMKSGNLNFLEPSGPLQACNGTDLPLLGLTVLCYNLSGYGRCRFLFLVVNYLLTLSLTHSMVQSPS